MKFSNYHGSSLGWREPSPEHTRGRRRAAPGPRSRSAALRPAARRVERISRDGRQHLPLIVRSTPLCAPRAPRVPCAAAPRPPRAPCARRAACAAAVPAVPGFPDAASSPPRGGGAASPTRGGAANSFPRGAHPAKNRRHSRCDERRWVGERQEESGGCERNAAVEVLRPGGTLVLRLAVTSRRLGGRVWQMGGSGRQWQSGIWVGNGRGMGGEERRVGGSGRRIRGMEGNGEEWGGMEGNGWNGRRMGGNRRGMGGNERHLSYLPSPALSCNPIDTDLSIPPTPSPVPPPSYALTRPPSLLRPHPSPLPPTPSPVPLPSYALTRPLSLLRPRLSPLHPPHPVVARLVQHRQLARHGHC
ncbi:unnamed protein product, partial [Closterium sp. Naga37s-1]